MKVGFGFLSKAFINLIQRHTHDNFTSTDFIKPLGLKTRRNVAILQGRQN